MYSPPWYKNWISWLFICLLLASYAILWKVGNTAGYNEGLTDGIDAYHNLCYTNPGTMMLSEHYRTVVLCGPLVEVPEEEIKKYNS